MLHLHHYRQGIMCICEIFAQIVTKMSVVGFLFYHQLHAKFELLKKTQVDEKKKLEEKRRMLVSQTVIIV